MLKKISINFKNVSIAVLLILIIIFLINNTVSFKIINSILSIINKQPNDIERYSMSNYYHFVYYNIIISFCTIIFFLSINYIFIGLNFLKKKNYFKNIYIFIILLITFLSIIERFSILQYPLSIRDNYVDSIFSYFKYKKFITPPDRNFFYPGLLVIFTSITKSFKSITIFQHILGILSNLIALLAWNQISKLYTNSKTRFIHICTGILFYILISLNTVPIYWEHTSRPEGITPFFFSVIFLCIVNLFQKNRILLNLNIIMIFNIFLYMHQPKWIFGMISISILYIIFLISFFKLKNYKHLYISMAIIFSLILSNNILKNRYQNNHENVFAYENLMYSHLKYVIPVMQKDIITDNSRYDTDLLKLHIITYNKYILSNKEKNNIRYKYRNIGFDFNELF